MSADARWALALIRLANSLGQRVPWANLLDAWPSDATALRHAIEDLTVDGLIQPTPSGLVTLGAPPASTDGGVA